MLVCLSWCTVLGWVKCGLQCEKGLLSDGQAWASVLMQLIRRGGEAQPQFRPKCQKTQPPQNPSHQCYSSTVIRSQQGLPSKSAHITPKVPSSHREVVRMVTGKKRVVVQFFFQPFLGT